MTEKRYVIPYSLDAQKRHYHKTGKGRIIEFVVQLEVLVRGEWKQVVRYDCSHDFVHRDLYNLKGERKKEDLQMKTADRIVASGFMPDEKNLVSAKRTSHTRYDATGGPRRRPAVTLQTKGRFEMLFCSVGACPRRKGGGASQMLH